MIEQLIVKGLHAELLEFFCAHAVGLTCAHVLLHAGHELFQAAEVVAILGELIVEVAFEVHKTSILSLGIHVC